MSSSPPSSAESLRLGLVADTHGFFDIRLPRWFRGVSHILHAGDIGAPGILTELESIAPVTAVRGNNDWALDLPETVRCVFGTHAFWVRHIVNASAPDEELQAWLEQQPAAVVVFGHTHQAYCQRRGSAWFVNPGYAGRPRWLRPRSVAVLTCAPGKIQVEFHDL